MKMKLVSFAILGALLLVPAIASAEVAAGNIGYGTQYGLTPWRLRALVAVGLGLISVVIGWLALARTASRFRTRMSIVAMALGLSGIIIAVLHLINSTGSWGTGNGRAGAVFAIVLGLTGIVIARLAQVRSRRTG